MPLHFANPWGLLLLLLVVPSVIAWRKYLYSPGVPALQRSVVFLRASALVLLVCTLAGAQWLARQRTVDVIFLADVSESVTPAAQARGLEFMRSVATQLRSHDRAGVIAFGREAYMDRPMGAQLKNLKQIEATPARDETDLQAALRLALANADEKRNVRVVVVGDGLATRGDAESLLPIFRQHGIPIDAFSLISVPTAEASVEQVISPNRVGQNQPFSLRVVTAVTYETQAKLLLFRNGQLISDKVVSLKKGQNVFDFNGLKEKSGVSAFEARIETAQDTYTQNNAGYATVTVEGPNRLLFVTDNTAASTALTNALRQQGMRVDVTSTMAFPANASTLSAYGAILLHDVSALKLTLTQQSQLASYVRNLGGGLVVVGGYSSYGLGGYYKTPLEEVMPVSMDAPQKLVMPSLAMLLVLDKSGSMAETQGKLSKVNLAKEAALGVLDVMTDRDLFGLLAFESVTRWVVPIQPATERELMAQQIGTLTADGGTDMGPAMLEAYNVLNKTNAMVKHTIILSDGQSQEYDFTSITKKLRSAGVTVSTVAIGTDSDRDLLERIAEWGGGRFYYTDDIRTIPQIFTAEAFMVSRPLAMEERFKPQPRQAASFLTGINQANLPALNGYVLTTPKATSTIHLEASEDNPVLASWRYGLGRVVAFTSGATTAWATDWLRWNGFGSFWSQTVRWAMRPESSSALRPYFDIHEGQGSVVVDALDTQGKFINFLNLRAEVLAPSGNRKALDLMQVSPGQYTATFPAGEQGTWLGSVTSSNDQRFLKPALIGTVLPYSAEYRLTGLDSGALERLAQLTGGTVIDGNKAPSRSQIRALLRHPHPVRTAIPLAPLFLALAFILFFVDIVVRYLPPGVAEKLETYLRKRIPVLNRYLSASGPGPTLTNQNTDGVAGELGQEDNELSVQVYGSAPDNEPEQAVAVLRLDELIARRQNADLASRPLYNFSKADPAKTAARYLARLRKARQEGRANVDEDDNDPGA